MRYNEIGSSCKWRNLLNLRRLESVNDDGMWIDCAKFPSSFDRRCRFHRNDVIVSFYFAIVYKIQWSRLAVARTSLNSADVSYHNFNRFVRLSESSNFHESNKKAATWVKSSALFLEIIRRKVFSQYITESVMDNTHNCWAYKFSSAVSYKTNVYTASVNINFMKFSHFHFFEEWVTPLRSPARPQQQLQPQRWFSTPDIWRRFRASWKLRNW